MNWPGDQQPDQWGRPQQAPAPAPNGSGGLSPMVLAFVGILLAVVVVIAVTVVVVSLNRSGSTAAPVPAPETASAVPAVPEPVRETEEPAGEPSSPDAEADVMQEGWQRAAAPKWNFVYEIPPREENWKFDGPTTIRGYEDDDGEIAVGMSGTSVYREDPCASWGSRTNIGAQGISDSDDTEEMAEGVALNWAQYAYDDDGDPELDLRSVEEFSANGLSGHHAIVDITVPGGGGDCVPPTAVVHAVAAPGVEADTTRILLVLTDTGVEDALTEETVDTIISTLRDSDHEI